MGELIHNCQKWVTHRVPHNLFASNVHVMVEGVFNRQLRIALLNATAVLPDGMPLVWFLRRKGHHNQERMYGPNVMLRLLQFADKSRLRIFLFGSLPSTLEKLTNTIRHRHPRLKIAGTYAPPFKNTFTAQDINKHARLINKSKADILFVGLGAPKQEIWMHHISQLLRIPVILGAGAGFDFIAKTKPQAPRWMMDSGLEWLFRLLSEPRRLWYRYAILNPVFLFLLLLQELGIWNRTADK